MKRQAKFLCAAVAAIALGCQSKPEVEKAPPAPPIVKPEAAAQALQTLQVPESVIAFGGTLTLETALNSLQTMANKAMPMNMPFIEMAKAIFQGTASLKTSSSLDVKKPVYFVLADAKKYRNPSVVVVGITGEEALVQALPSNELKQQDQGNAYSYLKNASAKTPVYVNFMPGYVVMTREAPLFAEVKPFLEALLKLPQSDLGHFTLRLDHVLKLYDGKPEGALARFKSSIRSIQKRVGPAANIDMQVVLRVAEQVLLEGDELQFTLRADDDGLQLKAKATPKAGTEFAKTVGLLKPEGSTLQSQLTHLPGDAPFWIGADLSMQKFADSAFEQFNRYILPQLGDDGAGLQTLSRPLFDAIAAGVSSSAVFAGIPEEQGLEFAALFGVRDAAKLKEAQGGIPKLIEDSAIKAAQEKLGVTLSFNPEVAKQGERAIAALTTKTPGLFPGVSIPTESHVFLSFNNELGAIAYGEGQDSTLAAKRIEKLLSAPLEQNLSQAPIVKRAFQFAAPSPFLITSINPVSLIHAIKMGGQNPIEPYVKGIECKSGLTLSLGTEKESLVFALDLPVELLQKGAEVFDKFKGSL